MNRKDIQELRVHCGFPALTLITTCEKGKVATVLKALLQQAGGEAIHEQIADRCEELLAQLSCPVHPYKSALFIDKHRAKAFIVPPEVPDCAVIDTTFRLDALIKTLNQLRRYWVIDCLGKAPRIIEGIEDALLETQSACIFVSDEEEYDLFDRCISTYLEQDSLPICIVGDAAATQRFELLAPYADSLIGHVRAKEDAWPLVQRWYVKEVEKIFHYLADGRPDVDFLVNLHTIIDAARQGQIATLVLEEDYVRNACEHPVSRAVLINQSCPTGYLSISLIEELMENVRAKGGRIFLAPTGSLHQYGRLVALASWL